MVKSDDCRRDQSFRLRWRTTSQERMGNMATECQGQKGNPIDSLSPNGLPTIRYDSLDIEIHTQTHTCVKDTASISRSIADLSQLNLDARKLKCVNSKPTASPNSTGNHLHCKKST